MHPILRIFLAILAGVFTGSTVINLIQSYSPYQPPPGVTYTSGALPYLEWVRSLPDQAWLIILGSLLSGCLLGGFVTQKFSPKARFPPPLITGFALLFYQIVQYLAFANPLWMTFASCFGSIAFAWIGAWMARLIWR